LAEKDKIRIVIEHDGKRVSIRKGSEAIWLDISGDVVHVSATSRNGGYTVASLKFLKDQVARLADHP